MGFVTTEVQGAVEIITIDRPQALNALNPDVLNDLKAAFDAVDQNAVRCIVVTGAGEKSFVAGADIAAMSVMTKAEGEAFGKMGNDIFRSIETFPMPVIAATSPTDCFSAAYMAAKIALEHLTPVVLLTDAFIANGSAAWRLPKMEELPEIHPHYATSDQRYRYTPYQRDPETCVRYWAIPGQEGYTHILGGLEKDGKTGSISTEPENHDLMDHLRSRKVARIEVPDLEVQGDKDDAELLIVGFGSTYGHLLSTLKELRGKGYKVALAQFKYVNPLPHNTVEVLNRYPKVVVAEQNLGQLAALLRIRINNFSPYQYNKVKGQPFVVSELTEEFEKILLAPNRTKTGLTYEDNIIA